MIVGSLEQRNAYKGSPPRPWVCVRLASPDGTLHEVELLADTGNPSAFIIGVALMAKLKLRVAAKRNSNFGLLLGGWAHISMPEFGVDEDVEGYARDKVVSTTKASHSDFEGLVGLPLLRLMEFGGNADWFWLRSPSNPP